MRELLASQCRLLTAQISGGKALTPMPILSVWHLYIPVVLSLTTVTTDRIVHFIWAAVFLLVGGGVVSVVRVINRRWYALPLDFG